MPTFVKAHRRGRALVKAHVRRGVRFLVTGSGKELKIKAFKRGQRVGELSSAIKGRGAKKFTQVEYVQVSTDARGAGYGRALYRELSHRATRDIRKSKLVWDKAVHGIYSSMGDGNFIKARRRR